MAVWKQNLDEIYNSQFLKPNPFRELSNQGIVLYGAGAMGKMALDFMTKEDILPAYISDKNKSGYLNNIKILQPHSIPIKERETFTFIVCIATVPITPIYDYLKSLGYIDIRHFYDYSEIMFAQDMSNGWISINPNKKDLESVFKILAHDENSLAHYKQFLWWRLKRKEVINNNFPVLSKKKFFKAPCITNLSYTESFLDAGAHHGQSIHSLFEKTDNRFDTIWAFEPDLTNMNILKNNLTEPNICFSSEALSDKCEITNFQEGFSYASKIHCNGNTKINSVSIDSLSINPTIIKVHVEGSELPVLKGAQQTIHKHRPIIMVMADHNSDGLYKIAKYLAQFISYKIYFYLHDFCGNTAVYYAIPNERNNKGN